MIYIDFYMSGMSGLVFLMSGLAFGCPNMGVGRIQGLSEGKFEGKRSSQTSTGVVSRGRATPNREYRKIYENIRKETFQNT